MTTNTEQIAFQTGRQYTAHGQRIAARRLDDWTVAMVDVDRNLAYTLWLPAEDGPLSAPDVLAAYDRAGSKAPLNGDQIRRELAALALAL